MSGTWIRGQNWWALLFAFAGALTVPVVSAQTTASTAPAAATSGPGEEMLQRQYVQQVSQQLETVLSAMSPDLSQSDPFFASLSAVNPDGKLAALALSRDHNGENYWSILLLSKATLEVTHVYDFIRAHHLSKLEWSPDGSCLLVLAEDVSLTGPPGSLILMDPSSKRAFVVDRGVWQYSLAPDGSNLVYERCEDVARPLDKRVICLSRFAKLLATLRDSNLQMQATPREVAQLLREQTSQPLKTLDYPREQLEGFKSWSGDCKVSHMTAYRYAPGAREPLRIRYALDVATSQVTELK
jgi:hypothetical protein